MKKNRHQSLIIEQEPIGHACHAGHARLKRQSRGFSLTELLVVLIITTLLTSLLLPAMRSLRENVNSVVCSSNLRQVGIGFVMYMDDNHERFPGSVHLSDKQTRWRPHELMSVHHGQDDQGWDGLGLLFKGGYCAAPQCFYCPSHRGEHPLERYLGRWTSPRAGEPIYGNYHYAGHRHWGTGNLRIWQNADRLVIATDGLRSASDFNHGNGMNVLYGDASVRWSTSASAILPLLPDDEQQYGHPPGDDYFGIWDNIQGTIHEFEP